MDREHCKFIPDRQGPFASLQKTMLFDMEQLFQRTLVRRIFHDTRGNSSKPPHICRTLPQIATFSTNKAQPVGPVAPSYQTEDTKA